MNVQRPMIAFHDRLRAVGLRPTQQRLALGDLLFANGHRHVSAEQLYSEAMDRNVRVSLATVYNTLHQFTGVGILREIVVEAGRSYFDTNVAAHHHYFFEDSNRLEDVPSGQVVLSSIPEPPAGHAVRAVDVVVRVDG